MIYTFDFWWCSISPIGFLYFFFHFVLLIGSGSSFRHIPSVGGLRQVVRARANYGLPGSSRGFGYFLWLHTLSFWNTHCNGLIGSCRCTSGEASYSLVLWYGQWQQPGSDLSWRQWGALTMNIFTHNHTLYPCACVLQWRLMTHVRPIVCVAWLEGQLKHGHSG